MLRYLKAAPTNYVLCYRFGRVVREGTGLSFVYFAPTTTLVSVPVASTDLPFVFKEVTADFQDLTIQGQLTYRIADAPKIAALLNFEIDAAGQYRTDDPEKVAPRLVNAAQEAARSIVNKMPLREALASSESIAPRVLEHLRGAEQILLHGIELLGLTIVSIKPTPETAKALEAEVREALLRKSDEAAYARRNAAVVEERTIRESELNTELAVAKKKREIRETEIQIEIMAEVKRTELLKSRLENDRDEADARGYALAAQMKPLKELDWRTLAALSGGGAPLHIAEAFRELAGRAEKIGQLNITPDLLRSLLARDE
jgi:hypothetical protein